MAFGVIDIGSHSIKLLIGEAIEREFIVLESLKNVVSIGSSTFLKGYIAQEPINLTIKILEKYKQTLQEYQVNQIFVIATTAVREASNRNIFIDTIRRKTGFEIDVLSVGDIVYYIDAYITHKLKDTYPLHQKNVLIGEMGAGSLDLSFLKKGFSLFHSGLILGSLRFKQLLGKIGGSRRESFEALGEYIENEFAYFKRHLPRVHIDDVLLIDENQEYLNALFSVKKVSTGFFQIEAGNVARVLQDFDEKDPDEIAQEHHILPEDVDMLFLHTMVLKCFFEMTQVAHIYVLETSLAEAVLANKILGLELTKKYNKTNQLLSMVHAICEQYNMDLNHAKQTATFAKSLFDGLKGQLGLHEHEELYLILAAYLHDIGKFISNRSHHKHSEYIINSLNLFRLTDEEIKMIAAIARYHRRGDPSKNHLIYNSLSDEQQIIVQKLTSLLRLSNALDHSHKQKVKKLEVSCADTGDMLVTVYTKDNFLLEKNDFNEKKDLLEKITGNKMKLVINENF